jgi:hypothetical protein
MPEKKTPLEQVKERFETKEKLVDEIVSLLKPPRGEREVVRERLRVQANSKLLRLHEVATQIKERFGDQEKLVDEILEMMGHAADETRKERLLEHGPGRLLDLHRQWEQRAGKKEAAST